MEPLQQPCKAVIHSCNQMCLDIGNGSEASITVAKKGQRGHSLQEILAIYIPILIFRVVHNSPGSPIRLHFVKSPPRSEIKLL